MRTHFLLEAEPETPEVYRSTPFEYAQTAEATQTLVICSKPVQAVRQWRTTDGSVKRQPPLPEWMTQAQRSDGD